MTIITSNYCCSYILAVHEGRPKPKPTNPNDKFADEDQADSTTGFVVKLSQLGTIFGNSWAGGTPMASSRALHWSK